MPAPAAPPAAPVAPAKPATPPAAPPPQNDAAIFDKEIDDDLAAMDDSRPVTPPPKSPDKPPAQPVKPAEKPAGEKPDEKAASEQTPAEPVRPVKAADLRNAYEGLKKKVREEFEPKIVRLQQQIEEFQKKASTEVEPVTKKLQAAEKRLEELESEIKYVNYQKSAEFRDKYEKPYQEAWAKAISDLAELSVPGEDGPRQATQADLLQIANLPLGEARKLAREMFGDSADDVMAHRRIIRDLSEAQRQALDTARKSAGEREKQIAEQSQAAHAQTIKLWQGANDELAKKYPHWFSPKEGDNDGNTLLNKGFALADLHFIGIKDLTPEQVEMLPARFQEAIKTRGDLTIQDRVALDALIRNKVASHDRLALRLKSANAKIAELEGELAEFKKSEPPGGKAGEGGGKTGTSPMEEADAELERIDRQNR